MYTDAVVVSWDRPATWADANRDGLVHGLSANGIRAHRIAIPDRNAERLIALVGERWARVEQEGGRAFVVDLQGRSPFRDLPRFSVILDHPMVHPNLAEAGPSTVLGHCDASHVEIAGYTRARSVFFPHAGQLPDPAPPPMDARPIEVLVAGHFTLAPGGAAWRRAFEALEPDHAGLVAAAAEAVAASPHDPYRALLDAAADRGFDPATLGWEPLCALVKLTVAAAQGMHRFEMLNGLKSLKVTVVGLVDADFFPDGTGNLTFLGQHSYPEILALMRRSKIVLNPTPKFFAGSHERIWSGMAAGAAVCTSPSRFVDRDFADGQSILISGTPAETVDTLAYRLSRPEQLQDLARAGLPAYREKHTYPARVRDYLLPLFPHRQL